MLVVFALVLPIYVRVISSQNVMEFVDSPLHIAAATGHRDFAMEMMNLKPSFARKLNQSGLRR